MHSEAPDIATHPIHLGLGATAEIQPIFTGEMAWYEDYVERHADDGIEGRLVTVHRFSEPWDVWEMHPSGSEVVLCISGAVTLHQQSEDGAITSVDLAAGRYAVNEPGTWHTADVEGTATLLFITAGAGIQHRPRGAAPGRPRGA